MSSMQAALVLGASGSVGNALIKELIRNGKLEPIVTLVRRSRPDQVAMARDARVELRETLVPAMDPRTLALHETEEPERDHGLDPQRVYLWRRRLGVAEGTVPEARGSG